MASLMDHQNLKADIKAIFENEADLIVRQLMARGQSMTTVALTDFELEARQVMMQLALKHAKTIRSDGIER